MVAWQMTFCPNSIRDMRGGINGNQTGERMAGRSKQITARVANAREVLSTLEVNGAELETQMVKVLFNGTEPKGLTVRKFLHVLSSVLLKSTDALAQTETAYLAELADDEAPRVQRDEADAEFRAQLMDARDAIGAVYGPSAQTALGLPGDF